MKTPSNQPIKKHKTFRIEEKEWNDFRETCKRNKVSSGKVLRDYINQYCNFSQR